MAFKPGKFGVYHLSSVPRPPEYDKAGLENFRGHGDDYSHQTDNIFYIMSFSLNRVVPLKAFFESFKLNFAKETEVISDKEKNSEVIRQYGAEISYDISLNMPAHSVNEAVNNLAKIEELQKLMSPHQNSADSIVPEAISSGGPLLFIIYFKNLIYKSNMGATKPSASPTEAFIRKNGITCSIEEIDFEPEIAAGFFEFDNYLYPKIIKLKLKFVLNDKTVGSGYHFFPFDVDGQYDVRDSGGFPFGVSVCNEDLARENNGLNISRVYKDDEVNKLEYVRGSIKGKETTYIFISNIVENNGVDKKCRWLVFKAFVESFRRDYTVDHVEIKSKGTDTTNQTETSGVNSVGRLEYKFKINLPAQNIEEAKRNCGKLSYLIRMSLTKQNDDKDTPVSSFGTNSRALRVYFPSFIEKAGASRVAPSNQNRSQMFDNSIEVYVMNVDLEIDLESGFFEDGTALYPKMMSLSFDLKNNQANLINNYRFNELFEGGKYAHLPSSDEATAGLEHLFPYNRKTIRLGRGKTIK